MSGSEDVTMKVGMLAQRTGLTVRTLHHYDEIGLLTPSRRTAAGHRLYGMSEVSRLQRIASLRQLGFSLEDIQACLDQAEYSLEGVLAMQIQRLKDEIGRQTRLVSVLEDLRGRVSAGEVLSVDEITAATEETVRFQKYYSPEQLADLRERADSMGAEGMRRAEADWAGVFRSLAEARESGIDPGDERVAAIVERAQRLIAAFTGGDPGIRASLERMYKDGEGARTTQQRGMNVDPDVMAYYQRAMAAHGSGPSWTAKRPGS